MVGVPRSTGCQTCVKRKIKCDETRPQCLRCTKLGVQCRGYDRPLQFRNLGLDEAQQHQKSRAARSQGTSGRRSEQVLLLSSAPTVDEIVAPNLVYEALTTQTKEVFYDWLIYHFPRVHASFVFRVDTDWMDFIRQLTPQGCPPALLWAIRTLITFQMGTLQRNEEAICCARHMYGRGIYHLRKLLQSSSALSDASLAACILLGGYEVLDGNDPKSWIVHAHGIRQLMCARGARAHKSGMGRTLMICFRPFFITEAFVLREPCFLAGSEWTSLAEDIFDDRQQKGQGELVALAMDHVFNEAAKCPGYYARTEAILLSNTEPAASAIEALSTEVYRTKDHLLTLQDKLNLSQANLSAAQSVALASVPTTHIESMTQLTLQGLDSAIALLDKLITVLGPGKQRQPIWSQSRHDFGFQGLLTLDAIDGRLPAVSSDSTTISSTNEPIGDWLDKFSLVMGMTNVPGNAPRQLVQSGSLNIAGRDKNGSLLMPTDRQNLLEIQMR